MEISVTDWHFFCVSQAMRENRYSFKVEFSLIEITETLMVLHFLGVKLKNVEVLVDIIRQKTPKFPGWYFPTKEEFENLLYSADKHNNLSVIGFYVNVAKVANYLRDNAEEITGIRLKELLTLMSLEPELNISTLDGYLDEYPVWKFEMLKHYNDLTRS